MRGMLIEWFHKVQHSLKIFGSDRHIPTGNDTVFDIISGDFLVRCKDEKMPGIDTAEDFQKHEAWPLLT